MKGKTWGTKDTWHWDCIHILSVM